MCDKIVPDQWILCKIRKAYGDDEKAKIQIAKRIKQGWFAHFYTASGELLVFYADGNIRFYKPAQKFISKKKIK